MWLNLTESLLLGGWYSLHIVLFAEVTCNAIGQYEEQRRQPAEQLEPAHYDSILHKDLQRENDEEGERGKRERRRE